MRYIIILYILFSTACINATSQNNNEELSKDREYYEILKKAEEVRQRNKLVMDSIDKKTSEIVEKTTEQIVSLKQEVKQLKQELNETNIKPTTNTKFKLLPISDSTDNR